jgi:hypothetical protein
MTICKGTKDAGLEIGIIYISKPIQILKCKIKISLCDAGFLVSHCGVDEEARLGDFTPRRLANSCLSFRAAKCLS